MRIFVGRSAMVLLVSLLLHGTGVNAAIFQHIPPQNVVAGNTFSLVLRLSSEATQDRKVTIVHPAANMTLTRMTREKYLLRWVTPGALPAEQIITVQAATMDSAARVEKQHIVIRSSGIRHPSPAPSLTTNSDDSRLSARLPGRHTVPKIKGIPTQIVSAGQTVQIRIDAPIENGRRAEISIDRLTSNAQLKDGIDGVPVFIWKTANADRGEHRFVFTAAHPSMAALQDTAEAVVIVEYSSASGASDLADASDEPRAPENLENPGNTPGSEVEMTPSSDGELAPEGANYFADTDSPPSDYPTDAPSNYPTDAPSDYPTDAPSDYPTDSPENDPAAGYLPGPEPGASSPPPDSQ